jgi:3-oxoacyl-[acyl-carrier-protein] synthase-3
MSNIQRSRILGTGSFLPANIRTNADLEKMVETSDQWIRDRTGISQRHIADDDMTTSDMAAEAAKRAMEAAGIGPDDLDMIIVGTVTGDMPMPATAVYVQQKIGASKCPAFDISAACAGFVYGVDIADKFIRTGAMKHILVIGVELLSRVIDWTDRSTCVLFGDGAGAAILGPSDNEHGVLSTCIHSDGSLADSLKIPHGEKVQMIGRDIFKAAVKNLSSSSDAAVKAAGLTHEDIDWIVPHQANTRIIDQVAKRAKYPPERVLSNIATVGNTSSASIPILLDQSIRNGTIKEGDRVLITALGAGVSWGAAVFLM